MQTNRPPAAPCPRKPPPARQPNGTAREPPPQPSPPPPPPVAARVADLLREELDAARSDARAELDVLAARHAAAAAHLDRAARALFVRSMELDNRALELERHETILADRERAAVEAKGKTDRAEEAVRKRERMLQAREASLKYSAVEQGRLHAWVRKLEERERRVGQAEEAEKDRIAARVATVARRELLMAEKERRLDASMQEREIALERREAVVNRLREGAERERAEAMLAIEAERSRFWAHQQRLSAVVATETEVLIGEQASLRDEFEAEAEAARKALREMSETVVAMKLKLHKVQSVGGDDSGLGANGDEWGKSEKAPGDAQSDGHAHARDHFDQGGIPD